jgi:hypothetical protein
MTRIVIHIAAVAVVLSGCVGDAPHDNPADPLSAAYVKEGALSGFVVVAGKNTGIAGAFVTDLTSKISVRTDSSGAFAIDALPAGSRTMLCTAVNYTNDTFQVDIVSGTTNTVTRALNGAPIVISQTILTRKIDQYFPSPQYFVDITADVTDPNGVADLDSVWFVVADSVRVPLGYSVQTKQFMATVYKYSIPTNTIEWLVGKPLTIVSRDVHGAVNTGEPFFVTRVIENEATPMSPAPSGTDTVNGGALIFSWSAPNVTFTYTYTLVLSRVDAGTKTVVWTYDRLGSFYEELAYPTDGSAPALSGGNYVWTIAIVDEFGNYARSKESSFVVN